MWRILKPHLLFDEASMGDFDHQVGLQAIGTDDSAGFRKT